MSVNQPAISFEGVTKSFGEKAVLRDVSFEVKTGEALCVLGKSGTGKSVPLKLLIGLVKADGGRVRIAGKDIGPLDEEALSRVRRKIGFMFQSAALFDSFSLYDNLALPLRRLTSKSRSQIAAEIDQVLRSVGLQADKRKMPAELSGGMRKRAGLARALVLRPDILLVDEPSSGLDRITAGEIDSLLLDVKRDQQTTMVIVTHDVRGARRVADRCLVLDQGSLLAIGTAAQLETDSNPTVRELISET